MKLPPGFLGLEGKGVAGAFMLLFHSYAGECTYDEVLGSTSRVVTGTREIGEGENAHG